MAQVPLLVQTPPVVVSPGVCGLQVKKTNAFSLGLEGLAGSSVVQLSWPGRPIKWVQATLATDLPQQAAYAKHISASL